MKWDAKIAVRLNAKGPLMKFRASVSDLSCMTYLERTDAKLRASLIIAGKHIVKLNFGWPTPPGMAAPFTSRC